MATDSLPKPYPSNHPDGSETTTLAFYHKRNTRSGRLEQVRFTKNIWRGKHILNVRVWYNEDKVQTEEGWRPGTEGVSVPENRLDALLEAVQHVIGLVKAEGRSTSVSEEGKPRNPRAQSASARKREEQGLPPRGRSAYDRARAHRAELDKGGAAPELPSGGNGQPSLVDDLAEYRR